MSTVDGMSYREWQKRNTDAFNKLTKLQQKKARKQGYYNTGWENVQKSWNVLEQSYSVTTLFDIRLKKGDLVGAIEYSMLEAELAKKTARSAVKSIDKRQSEIHALARKAQDKYQLL